MNRSENPKEEVEMPKSESPTTNEEGNNPDRSSESTSPVDSEESTSPVDSEESTDRSESSSSPEGDDVVQVKPPRRRPHPPLDDLPEEIQDIVAEILDEVEEDLEQNEQEFPEDESENPEEVQVLDPHEVWEIIQYNCSEVGIIENVDFNRCKFDRFIEELPEELPHCKILLCNDVGLTTLEGMPNCPMCHTLDLSGNDLPFSEIIKIMEKTPIVEQLNLNGNQVNTFEELDQILAMKTLLTLDLYGNGITRKDGYREHVFEKCPDMRYLDGYDRNGVEIEEDSDEYESDSDGDDEAETDEEEDIPLSYLDSSKCLEDDDSEDFKDPMLRKRKAASVPNENAPVPKLVKQEVEQDSGPSKVTEKAVVTEVKKQEPAEVVEA
uniref:LRRcap domain-containing protein n=1 Tax=Panagrellus redivivus TaxID=6233 RepID=A0A7E4UQL2_PANRE